MASNVKKSVKQSPLLLRDDPVLTLGCGFFSMSCIEGRRPNLNKKRHNIRVGYEFGNVVGKIILKLNWAAYIFSVSFKFVLKTSKSTM